MNDEMRLRLKELTENPTARVPVCLALDTSGSMNGAKMLELNAAIRTFFDTVRTDDMASIAAEIAVVTFGGSAVKVLDFADINRQKIPVLDAEGATPMGAAVSLSLDMLEQVKRQYSKVGDDYFQPWLVLMTDGESTDDITQVALRCREMVSQRKLTVFPIAIGKDANLQTLSAFSPNLEPLRMESTDLRRFFAWLSMSVATTSLANPGDTKAASFGETAFRKASVDWHTGFNM
jgi:uncharacterized protein YegL